MRLLELALHRYGAFTDRRITLGRGLTLVVGSNEAGKSTALEAFSDLLWGIPRGSTADFQHSRARLSLGGEVSLGEESLTLLRDSRRLTDAAGAELEPAPWASAADNRNAWRTSFGLSHADLRAGGEALCAGGGDLAELVFTARSGQSLRGVLESVGAEADGLWKAHGNVRNVVLRKAQKEYEGLVEQAEQATSRASAVEAAREAARRTAQEATRASGELAAARATHEQLLGRGRAAGQATRLAVTDAALRELAEQGPGLDAAGSEVLAAAVAARHAAQARLSELEGQAEAVAARLSSLEVDDALLSDGDTLRRLVPVSEAREHDGVRAAELTATVARLRRTVTEELAALGAGLGPQDLPGLQVPVGLAADLDSLGADLANAQHLVTVQESALETARDELARTLEGSDPLPLDAVAAVREAVRAVRAEGSAAQRLLTVTEALADARQERAAQLARAGLGAAAPVPESWPVLEEVAAGAEALRHALEAGERAVAEVARLHGEVTEAERALAGTPGSEDTLQAWVGARTERTRLLDATVLAWLSGAPASEHPGLAVQLERAVQAADDAAEAMVAGADLRARAGEAVARVEQCRERHACALATQAEAAGAAEAAQERWRALWAEIPAPTPAQAGATLDALEAARQADLEAERHAEVLEALRPLLAEQAAGLQAALAAAGRPRPDAGLEALLAAADDLARQADDERDHRSRTETRAADVTRLAARLADAEKVRDEVLLAWASRVGAAGLDAELQPAGWQARQQTVSRAVRAESEALAAEVEALAAGARHAQHLDAVDDLSARHGAAATPPETLRELADRLRQAEADAHERASLGRQQAALAEDTRRHQGALTECAAVLAELAAATGVPDEAGLAAADGRGAQARVLLAERAQRLEAIRAAVPGADPEVLAAELAAVDAAALAAETADAEAEVARVEGEQGEALVRSGERRRELAELSQGEGAAALHAEAQGRLAAVAEAAERWVVAEVQRRVLTAELAEYESLHASPLLEGASALLSRLTAGRWTALERSAVEGARTVVVVAADGSRLRTSELSEGTADQVFLALRLAGIAERQRERVAEGLPTLPVVLDDVLMTFDDRRAATALAVLAELAREWQVVVFSHHHHLAGLPLPPEARAALTVTRLPSPLSLVDGEPEAEPWDVHPGAPEEPAPVTAVD